MRLTRYITAFIVCLLAIAGTQAQNSNTDDRLHVIEVFLDETPAIYGSNLNLNDFFSDSYVTAKVYADEDSTVTRIKIKKCRTMLSGNSDQYSLETAEELLKESCRNIIMNRRWKPGKSECCIVWNPRHNHTIEKEKADSGLISFITGLVTDETKKRLYKHEGSAFIRLKLDPSGKILDANHVGNIFWGAEDGTANTTDLSFSMQSEHFNSSAHSSMMFKPRFQPPSYMSDWELELYKADKQLSRNAKEIARQLKGMQFAGVAGKEREICIEISIDTSDIEIEESDPEYPGGVKALKEYYTRNFRYNRVLRKNNIKGSLNVGLLIKKSGKAKVMYIEMHESSFSYEGRHRWEKIEKETRAEIKRITRKMPRWTPGRYDGKNIEMKCSFRFRINGID